MYNWQSLIPYIIKMHNCEHHHSVPHETFFGSDELGIIFSLFILGLAGSFTHCIGMCGPFAIAQTSMRLMNIPNSKLTQLARLKASMLLPYYFGKAVTYCILLTVAFFLSENFKNTPMYKYVAATFLALGILMFIKITINKNFNFIRIPFLEKLLANKVDVKSTQGINGFFVGMVLGMIPCGLVYAAIVAAVSGSSHYLTAVIAMFSFGLATIPGLFVVSYFGQFILKKYAVVFVWSF